MEVNYSLVELQSCDRVVWQKCEHVRVRDVSTLWQSVSDLVCSNEGQDEKERTIGALELLYWPRWQLPLER